MVNGGRTRRDKDQSIEDSSGISLRLPLLSGRHRAATNCLPAEEHAMRLNDIASIRAATERLIAE